VLRQYLQFRHILLKAAFQIH